MPRSTTSTGCLFLAGLALLMASACDTPESSSSNNGSGREVAVRVDRVALDSMTGSPVVILEEEEGSRSLPIWIGLAEARSIASELESVVPPRPNTHDLAKRLLQGLDGEVDRVVVTDLRGGTYYAQIQMHGTGGSVEVDSRPSDAIALALRLRAPIFVRSWLFRAQHEGNEAAEDERSI